MDRIILAIESSCDETACAVVRNGNEILSNVVSTQINIHQKFGGVVPEVASRIHVENISLVIEEGLEKSGLGWEDIDAIAITQGPGLIGSLHVGVMAAKTLAWMHNKPLIPLHHIIGHIYANAFIDKMEFPLLALVVSGGHTELILMNSEWEFEILGTTQDDAIGEAYDKVARVLGLPYPGGPAIDKLAKQGQPHYKLPVCKTENELDFSFSGLKSAVLQLIDREKRKGNEVAPADVAYAFQETALHDLVRKTIMAIEQYPVKQLVVAGGVAANSRLREILAEEVAKKESVHLTLPPLWCCTDNAAMIGAAGCVAYDHVKPAGLDLSATPSKDLTD